MTLRDFRIKQGLSQEQVAEALGITVSAYCYYENGKRKIPKGVVDSLIVMLKIPKKHTDIFLPTNFTLR